MNPYEYVETHRDAFLEELFEFLRIPSISTLSEHAADVRRAAEWLKAHLEGIGMTHVELVETARHPIVYAEWLGAPGAPTVLIYGHYDVQPVDDPEGQWQSDPFEPVLRDGNIYARGATDDKGQTLTQIKAIQALLASGQMPINVKFVIEGEEESGSDNLYPFVEQNAERLAADVIVISDTGMKSIDHPSVVYGLRGIAYMEIEVRGPRQDLHSGMYGGVVHNPAQALVEILAKMHDEQGRVMVPGFYDRVDEVGAEERAELAKTPLSEEQLRNETGVPAAWGEPGYAIHERLAFRPTLEINGLVSGWTGEGAKTVLPAKALAKVSCRLVPRQDPREIFALVRDFVRAHTPPTVTSEVRLLHQGMWAVVDLKSREMQAALQAYEFGFGKRPTFVREGGSVPIVGALQRALQVPVVLMGFGQQDDNLHGPNEKFALACFEGGLRTTIKFYELIGQRG